MSEPGTVVIVGGTSEIGEGIGRHYAELGHPVVLTSRDAGRAQAVAAAVGPMATGIALDLTRPHQLEAALAGVDNVKHLALVSVWRDENKISDYNVNDALQLVTLKLVGYTEVVHVLAPRMQLGGGVLLFGGLAKDRPYPGSTTVTSVNGGVTAMVRTMAVELAPLRVNAIHPGVVGDSPYWAVKPPEVLERFRSRTPLGNLVTIEDVVGASIFLLENAGVTGVNLRVDGGWMLT